jgi:hypothetical protein
MVDGHWLIPKTRVIAVALLALGTATCGGDTESGSRSPAVGEAFASRAADVCKAARTEKKAQRPLPDPDFNPTQPDPLKLPGLAPFLAETVVTFKAWLREMQALGQPPTGQGAWADLVTAVESHVRIASEQQAAAQRGDAQTFIKDYNQGTETQDMLLRAAIAAGVPECAAVDR